MRIQAFAVVCLLVAASTADADVIEHHLYIPTSLPSAQGWLYQSNGFEESEVFAIVDNLLVMDTMGDGMDGVTFAHYFLSVVHPDVRSAVLRLRARVTAHEHDASRYYLGFFFGGYAPGPGPWFLFGLQENAVYINNSYLQGLDTGMWHEYTVITQGLAPDTQCTLLIDDQIVAVLEGDSPNLITSAFALGDNGRHANARVEIAEVEVTTFDGAPVAVEQRSFSSVKAIFAK
jgi:hypothetical protein